MTAASPQSVDLDEQRAELKSVLDSPTFIRAPKLAQLLSYLCERLFAGKASQIKEYSIGVEVFQRGEKFDQNSDSIVRVEANRLRKRLAEYSAKERRTGCASPFPSDNMFRSSSRVPRPGAKQR
jgi:hypothetical protein